MADLQLCFFCGSGPDGSLGEYSVVPAALDPTPEQQQSVVLCTDCRRKLTTVMEPVVEAAQEKAASGADLAGRGDDDGIDARDAGVRSPDDDADAEETGGDVDGPAAGGPRGAEDAGTAADPADPAGASPQGGDPPDDATADEPPGPESVGAGDGAGSESPDPHESASGSGATDDPLAVGGDADGAGAAGGSGGAPADAGAAGGDGPDSDGDGDPGGPPPDSNAKRDQPHADDELVGRNNEAYNKTLRLLQNREFPVERHEIEQVAASAYQLDPQEVSDAIDALINKGLLSQEGAQLVRT